MPKRRFRASYKIEGPTIKKTITWPASLVHSLEYLAEANQMSFTDLLGRVAQHYIDGKLQK